MAERAASFLPDMAEYNDIFSHFDSVRDQLPKELLAKLVSVSEVVDSATNQARAADAELQAVHQVLLAKQEAAQKARDTATKAIDKMKGFMSELLVQYPMMDHSQLLISDPDDAVADHTLIQLDTSPAELIQVQH